MSFRPAAAVLILGMLLPSGAEAFNCSIPAVFSATKKAVCSTPALAIKDKAEQAKLVTLRSKLGADVMPSVTADRRTFLSTRDGCGSDKRCLDATYSAQLRLYRKLEGCSARGAKKSACVRDLIDQHRQDLSKSL
jgi:uncharacterized protein